MWLTATYRSCCRFGNFPTGGLAPLAGATRDVLGPIARTVRDVAIAYDVMTAYGTPAFVGKAPAGGYTALLGEKTLEGSIIGLYGPSWGPEDLSPEVAALYAVAVAELKALGATVVEDPFAGTGFAKLKFPQDGYDKRGSESVAYDFYYYLKGLGIDGFDEFRDIVGVSPFDKGQPLGNRQEGLPPAESAILLESLKVRAPLAVETRCPRCGSYLLAARLIFGCGAAVHLTHGFIVPD